MSAATQDPAHKGAKLTLKLKADSGYSATAEYRISANQWSKILGIAEDGDMARKMMAADEMYAALKNFMVGDGHDDFEDEWPAARAALAKADGQR